MAIDVIQTPNQITAYGWDMAYGANPITLSNLSSITGGDKYALRILALGNPTPLADIRQTPNRQGRAIFDIQNILQAYIGPQVNTIDSLFYGTAPQNERMSTAGPTLLEYQIQYAAENGGSIPATGQPGAWETISSIFTVVAGSKQYFDVPFNTDPYRPELEGGDEADPCTVIERAAGPLSDNSWTIADTETGDNLLTANGGYPSPGGIDMHNVFMDDQCTKTFYQKAQLGVPAPPAEATGIDAFHVLQVGYQGTVIITNLVPNIQANGGGPNVSMGQGIGISGVFQTITLATGPANLPIGVIHPNTTHYYIVPVTYTPNSCSPDPQSQLNLMNASAWKTQRYNIAHTKQWGPDTYNPSGPEVVTGITQLDAACNDYSHIQFAWQNSLGYRDQFTFTKKVNHNTRTKNNNFLKGAADYNSSQYAVDLQDRGYTTYSQKIENDFTVMSDYMNDAEAELLKHLYQSAEVKVRFSEGPYANQWVPVTITRTAYNEKTYRKDRLFQYTVNFRLASNIKSMRG